MLNWLLLRPLLGQIIIAQLIGFVIVTGSVAAEPTATARPSEWQPLFNRKDLTNWKITKFGGEGDVYVEDGQINLDFGSSLTGITYGKDFPKDNYELRLEAKRLEGTDFFCGLTFPVQTKYLTLVVGGWGGAVVGLSSIDGEDASENDTQKTMAFKRNTWYRIRIRIQSNSASVWINDQLVIKKKLKGHELSIRPEVNLSRPLGICAWETRAVLRKLEWRSVSSQD